MKIELKAGLCAGRRMISKCGLWTTNGSWLVRTALTKAVKSTPKVDVVTRPDYDQWLSNLAPTADKTGTLEPIRLEHAQAISSKGEIVTWVNPDFYVFLDLGTIWIGGPLDPIMVSGDDKSADPKEAIAWVMPMNLSHFPKDRGAPMLARWLAGGPT